MALALRLLPLCLLLASTAAAQTTPPSETERAAQALIDRLKSATTPAEERAASLEIMQNYYAKLRLKSPGMEAVGAKFYQTVKGANSLMSEVRARVKADLIAKGWQSQLVAKIDGVENRASRLAMKAPMDIDEGILSTTAEGNRDLFTLFRATGGPASTKDVVRFTEDAEALYQATLRDVARGYGVTISDAGMKTVNLTFATPWHPEAYLASEVLKAGGVAPTSLMQQTVDVTSYKLVKLRDAYDELRDLGRADEAVVEAARATLKDLDKVERVFAQVELVGGPTPQLSTTNAELIAQLKRIEADPALARTMARADVELMFARCQALVGTMESAVVLQGPAVLLKATLYRQLPEGLRQVAVEALASGMPVPDAARWIDDEIARTVGARVVTLGEEAPGTFVSRLKAAWPDYKLTVGDAGIEAILTRVETLTESELKVLVGEVAASRIVTARTTLTAPARHRLLQRFLPNGLAEPVEQNTLKMIGKAKPPAGSAFAVEAPLAIVLSMASGLARTAEITARDLPDAEQRRQLLTAWVESLPVTGEILQGLGRVNAFVVSGDSAELAEAALSIAMGISWVVPPAQVPVLVATVLAGGARSLWSAVQATRDRLLISDWVESGVWNLDRGTLEGLLDTSGRLLPVPPAPSAVQALFVEGRTVYHSPRVVAAHTTIRESLVAYLDRSGFAAQPAVDVLVRGLNNLFPDFDVLAALRKPEGEGRAELQARVARDGGKAALSLYAQLERLYETAAQDALQTLKADAELEFQTTHMVGAAKDAFAMLTALGDKLRLPLLQRLEEQETAVTAQLIEKLKTPWERHGIEARVVTRVVDTVAAYRRVDTALESIRQMLRAESVEPPAQFNLTGYRSIDESRAARLRADYQAAIARAKADAAQLAVIAKVSYDPSSACAVDIRQTLVRLAAVQVLARDWQLLAEQWSGRASAASIARDTAIAQAQAAAARGDSLPTQAWRDLVTKAEDAYAWTKAPEAWAGGNFSDLAATARERASQAERDYEAARQDGQRRLASGCQSPAATAAPSTTRKAETPVADSPEAVCTCLNEWYEKKYFPEMVAFALKTTTPDKVVQASYTMVRPFAYDASTGNCRGAYRVARQYLASRDYDTAKRGQTYWNIEEARPDSNVLSVARQRCRDVRGGGDDPLTVTVCSVR